MADYNDFNPGAFSVLLPNVGGTWEGQGAPIHFTINPTKGAVPMEPTERLGHLRAALEDAESDLADGHLTRAGERVNDARGIAMHLLREAESVEVISAEVRAPARGYPLFTETDIRMAIARVKDRHGFEYANRLIDELGVDLQDSEPAPAPGPECATEETELDHYRRRAEEAEKREAAVHEEVHTLLGELAGEEPAWWVKAGRAVVRLEALTGRRGEEPLG